MGVHAACIEGRSAAPNGMENGVAREWAVGVLKEKRQQVIFGGREVNLPIAAGSYPAIKVDVDIVKRQHPLLRARPTPKEGADAREELARTERLDDMIVRTDFKQDHFIDLLPCGAKDNYGSENAGAAETITYIDAA